MKSQGSEREREGGRARRSEVTIDWQSHPSVNSTRRCPYCAEPAMHEQHCKQICLSCGWYKSCVD